MDVQEVHGVFKAGDLVRVVEVFNGINLVTSIEGNIKQIVLTSDEARYLASKLYRLARRLEAKGAQS